MEEGEREELDTKLLTSGGGVYSQLCLNEESTTRSSTVRSVQLTNVARKMYYVMQPMMYLHSSTAQKKRELYQPIPNSSKSTGESSSHGPFCSWTLVNFIGSTSAAFLRLLRCFLFLVRQHRSNGCFLEIIICQSCGLMTWGRTFLS
jgi:hypothetical protein